MKPPTNSVLVNHWKSPYIPFDTLLLCSCCSPVVAMYGMLPAVFAALLWMCSDPLGRTSATGRRIDCTKFVFAPKCRGIAAKRVPKLASASVKQWPPVLNRPAAGWKTRDDVTDKQLQRLIQDELQHLQSEMAERRHRPYSSTTWQPDRRDTKTRQLLVRTLRGAVVMRNRRW
ncbi:hypothetical protein LSAT2_020694 [Lamellibrachia satsuma]|nr:hypothetical protein LSAT2_020694 [Lamellibrachia satsuma]